MGKTAMPGQGAGMTKFGGRAHDRSVTDADLSRAGPIYQCLAPWAEAALRAVVGLWLVPHALRNTFGFFPTTGVRANNLTALAAQLDRDGYRPGKDMGAGDLGRAARRRAAAGTGPVHAPGRIRDPDVPPGHQYRALAGRQILLESARPGVHRDVDGRDVLFSRVGGGRISLDHLIGRAFKDGSTCRTAANRSRRNLRPHGAQNMGLFRDVRLGAAGVSGRDDRDDRRAVPVGSVDDSRRSGLQRADEGRARTSA